MEVKQGSTRKVPIYLVDSSDHRTPKTGVTAPTIAITKNGADTGAPNDGTWAEVGSGNLAGWYTVQLDGDDTDTLGFLGYQVTGTGADVFVDYVEVVANLESDTYGRLGAPAGASVSADIATVDGVADNIYSRIGAPAGASIAADIANCATLGTGATTWTYTVTDADSGLPIADVDVWVTTDEAGNNVVASGRSNANGMVTFYLDNGTVYVWRQKSGYNFTNPDTEVVS